MMNIGFRLYTQLGHVLRLALQPGYASLSYENWEKCLL